MDKPLTPIQALLETSVGARNYAPLPVTLTHGAGVWLWDDSGKRYLDFMSAYSAVSHGHSHPRLLAALFEQAHRLAITSRAFRNDRLEPFLRRLVEVAGLDMALPMNTGAEAVETAIKAARRWGYRRMKIAEGQATILVASGNFHGRTTTITGFSTEAEYRADFGPFTPGFQVIPYGDAAAAQAAMTPNVCAILIEPIQGEAGIVVPPSGYLKALRALCDRTGALLLLDEIQSGLGRTGRWFAFQHEDIVPDGIMVGKALGGGLLPVSAFVARAAVMELFTPGSHGSTFGGNPLAAHVALEALNTIDDEQLVERSAILGAHLKRRLQAMHSPAILEVRGRGLWAGLVLDPIHADAAAICLELAARGVLTRETHHTVIRIAPPLVITKDELDGGLDRIEQLLARGAPKPRPVAAPVPPMPTLIMCAPEHFAVTYKINPWMAPGIWSQDHQAHHANASRGWAALREAYEAHGAQVKLLTPQPRLPDMVFTANAALAHGGKVLLPRFRHAERQGEEVHLAGYFEGLRQAGLHESVHQTPENVFFEGAGDCLWDGARGHFWLGHGYRSDKAMAGVIAQLFAKPVLALELADPRYYHLDTCLAPLSGGEILYYPPAFTGEGRALMEAMAGSANLIAASDEDAALFAVNCFELPGKHIFIGPCSPGLEAALRDRGYQMHHFPLESFTLSGGSARCLTLGL